MNILIFATENTNKFREVEYYLKDNPNIKLEIFKPENEILEIQSLNREEICSHKLHEVINQIYKNTEIKNHCDINIWLVVEDTSLAISEMGGFPGPYVKHFINSMSLTSICNKFANSSVQNIVSLGYVKMKYNDSRLIKYDTTTQFIEGIIDGIISETPRGTNGFGYDPIVIPDIIKNKKTYAEMTQDEKNKYNPRTLAFELLVNKILNQ